MYRLRSVGVAAGACALAASTYYYGSYAYALDSKQKGVQHIQPTETYPTRDEQIKALQDSSCVFDVLVIGGGATGTGVAVDAQTRGLKTALVEREDFSCGTSSRSTKLIHGGVRYLEKAVKNLDREQYALVKEALHERSVFLNIAPHLTQMLPIMLPIYKWWQVPYFWAGAKLYDWVAGSENLCSSYFLNKEKSLERFPMLWSDKLVGSMIYYDGQQNDSRMNLTLALTSAIRGAAVANYVEVTKLLKSTEGEVCGATVTDLFSGKSWDINAKCVINATGPFCDSIRKMDDANTPTMVQPSLGVHVVLPEYYSPNDMGLLDPSTSDGRVLFFLPWQGKTVAGTTDTVTNITQRPQAREEDIRFILEEVKHYLSPDVHVRRGDVLSAWSGIRPLVSDPAATNTQAIARTHVVHVSPSKLLTIVGGKWTTYRAMAEHVVDTAIKERGLKPTGPCVTASMKLMGSTAYSPTLFIRLIQDYGLEKDVAMHLAKTYGDRAFAVAKRANITGKRWPLVGTRLVDGFPYIEAEVIYAVKEYARSAVDFLAYRSRLAFLNVQAAEDALPRVIEIMTTELGWDKERQAKEKELGLAFLDTMGRKASSEARAITKSDFDHNQIAAFRTEFEIFDNDGDGHITALELRQVMRNLGENMSDKDLFELIAEVDTNRNGMIEFDEFLQLMSALKSGVVASNRFATLVSHAQDRLVSVDRSGGGL